MIGSQRSVNILIENLDQENLELLFEIIKALNKLRVNYQELRFPPKVIQTGIFREVENYYRMLVLLNQHQNTESDENLGQSSSSSSGEFLAARRLLSRIIHERLDVNMERIFRLLGLIYPPDDIYNAYRGIISDKSQLRLSAMEFLDNLLDPTLRRYIVPIVESTPVDNVFIGSLTELYGPDITLEDNYINLLLEGADDLLKVCTIFMIAHSRQMQWFDNVNVHARSPVAIISETAKYAVQRLKKVV